MGQVLCGDLEHRESAFCLGNAGSDPPQPIPGLERGPVQGSFPDSPSGCVISQEWTTEGNNSAFDSSPLPPPAGPAACARACWGSEAGLRGQFQFF